MITELTRIAQCDGCVATWHVSRVCSNAWAAAREFGRGHPTRAGQVDCFMARSTGLGVEPPAARFDYTYDSAVRPLRKAARPCASTSTRARLPGQAARFSRTRRASRPPRSSRGAQAAAASRSSRRAALLPPGQFEGGKHAFSAPCRVRKKLSMRALPFYDRLLAVLKRRLSATGLKSACGSLDGNQTWDNYVAYSWQLGRTTGSSCRHASAV